MENLTVQQEKAIALMQYKGEDFFIIQLEDEAKIYEGNEEDARAEFLADIEGTEEADIDINFDVYCSNNLTEVEEYDDDNYNNDYLVLTDDEADEKAADYIKDSLWAFNASFLSSETGYPIEVFEGLQDKCESANDAVGALIDSNKSDTNLKYFIDAAISADGRGHFMSSYDGNENEETINGTTYYIYRQN